MGTIKVHEFTTLDGVIDAPTWTFDYPFDPKMGDAIADLMGGCTSILLGRRTFEMFAPAWSADTDVAKPEPTGADLPLAMSTSPPMQPGPVVDRESLANEASATVVEGESQPTRTFSNLAVGKRYAGKRNRIVTGASVAYARPVYRHSLMLGIGY